MTNLILAAKTKEYRSECCVPHHQYQKITMSEHVEAVTIMCSPPSGNNDQAFTDTAWWTRGRPGHKARCEPRCYSRAPARCGGVCSPRELCSRCLISTTSEPCKSLSPWLQRSQMVFTCMSRVPSVAVNVACCKRDT